MIFISSYCPVACCLRSTAAVSSFDVLLYVVCWCAVRDTASYIRKKKKQHKKITLKASETFVREETANILLQMEYKAQIQAAQMK